MRNMYGSASETIMATTISVPPKACCADIGSLSHTTLRIAAVTGSMQNNTAASAGPSWVCARDCPQKANTVEPRARYTIGPKHCDFGEHLANVLIAERCGKKCGHDH